MTGGYCIKVVIHLPCTSNLSHQAHNQLIMAFFKITLLVFIAHQSSALAGVIAAEGNKNVRDNLTEKIKESLEELCKRLPGPGASKICKDQIDKNLPMAIAFLTSTVKPGQVCSMLGLCGTQSDISQQKMLTSHIREAMRAAMIVSEVQFTPECTFCIYLVKTVERLLPKERTESAVIDLLGRVCGVLPASVKDQCEGLIENYGKRLLDLLLSYATPQAICSIIHMCKGQETQMFVESSLVSDCDSCVILAVLSRLNLGSNATEIQTSSYLSSVCQLHPNILPKCDSFTKNHGEQLKGFLGKKGPPLDVCGKVGLCGGMGGPAGQKRNPCTLGSSYTCRDLKTALECGTVPFCQEHIWE
ncbi:prosaposin-like isoform X3 [Hypomesus transpacificus]|uniref:prosaposin-like isoform X3 n=1 Tax=Hypomesus transpacificus TaxID=137520 RepID=UPI001F071C64|nr:prosaposin-like isoform X3 [Hypomesus transpacificus]